MPVLDVIEALDTFLLEQRRTRRERVTFQQERSLRARLREFFGTQENLLLSGFLEGMNLEELTRLWEQVSRQTFDTMSVAAQSAIVSAYTIGTRAAQLELGTDIAFDLRHPRAEGFIRNRGAELVTQINDTTRRETRRILSNGLRNGDSFTDVAGQLRKKFQDYRIPKPQQHIRDRAELIAVQEMGEAYEQGNLDIARELRDLGVPMEKSLLIVGDGRVDEDCENNAGMGWIPLEMAYNTGNMRPPIHVACRCTQLTRRIGSNA